MSDLPLSAYSVSAIRALNMAAVIARGAEASALTTEHLLLALVNQQDGNARALLVHHFDIDPHALRAALDPLIATVRAVPAGRQALPTDDGGRYPLAPLTEAVLERARGVAAAVSRAWAGTDHILGALLQVETPAGSILRRFGVTPQRLMEALETVARNGVAAERSGPQPAAVDLVRRYAAEPPPLLDRPAYTARLLSAFAHEGRRGLLLVGEPGVGKRSLVHYLALLLARDATAGGIVAQLAHGERGAPPAPQSWEVREGAPVAEAGGAGGSPTPNAGGDPGFPAVHASLESARYPAEEGAGPPAPNRAGGAGPPTPRPGGVSGPPTVPLHQERAQPPGEGGTGAAAAAGSAGTLPTELSRPGSQGRDNPLPAPSIGGGAGGGGRPGWLPGAIWAVQPAALLDGVEAGIRAALELARGEALLVPDLHLYVGGSTLPGWAEAGTLLRRALVTGEPHLIGTTTPTAYARHFEPDPTLIEGLAVIRVEPATVDETLQMLELRRGRLEAAYGLRIAPEAMRAAAGFAKSYLPQPLPAAGVALLEAACALVRTALAGGLAHRTPAVAPDGTVDEGDVAFAVHQQTGIPIGQMLGPERERLARIEPILKERVVGQDEAIRAVANAVRRARAGLKDPKRPIGSFIFLGPTGVGKTEVARAVAEFLFGTEEALIQIDMSEYAEKHTAARLLGAPPGYVGYEEGGQLTEKVRARPYAVVLFDEIEKAHPDVFNLFLQLLEEGWLTDGKGRRVDFRNTVIIMTSNLGTEHILGSALDRPSPDRTRERVPATAEEPDSVADGPPTTAPAGEGTAAAAGLSPEVRERVLETLRARFRPEFLNRVDAVVLFRPRGPPELRQILGLFRKGRQRQLTAGPDVTLEVSEAARDWLLAQYDQPEYGARPLRRLVDTHLRDELGARLISGEIAPGSHVCVDVAPGGTGLTFTPLAAGAPPG